MPNFKPGQKVKKINGDCQSAKEGQIYTARLGIGDNCQSCFCQEDWQLVEDKPKTLEEVCEGDVLIDGKDKGTVLGRAGSVIFVQWQGVVDDIIMYTRAELEELKIRLADQEETISIEGKKYKRSELSKLTPIE